MYRTVFDPDEIPADIRQYFEETEARCGAPWARVVAREASEPTRKNYAAATAGALLHNHRGTVERPGGFYPAEAGTTGWQPTCPCPPAEPIPQVCLDPFAGSGTTLYVARHHGRRAVGIELNLSYAKLAADRLKQGTLALEVY